MSITGPLEEVLRIGRRFLDPETVLATTSPAAAGSLAGLAGTALLHARLAATDPDFATAAARHWTAAAHHAARQPAGQGIHASPGGLATSLIIGTPYLPDAGTQHAAIGRAAQWLSDQAVNIHNRHHAQRRTGDTTAPWAVYDAINGLSGIGRILLAAVLTGHPTAEHGLHAALETLTAILTAGHGTRPGWWLPASAHPSGVTMHPSGAANTGMAHGVAGPLSLLSIASTTGWAVPGQLAAIRTAADWLMHWREPNSWTWPPYITGDELDHHESPAAAGRRDAWCYGTPGISRALAHAGHALNDATLTHAAHQAITALAEHPIHEWDTHGPYLCHGTAGVLACATASEHVTTSEIAPVASLVENSPHDSTPASRPGFLNGQAGVALALSDQAMPTPPAPCRWDAVLLLA